MTTEPTYPFFPICAFISFILVLIPLPCYLKAGNIGICSFMLWTAVACLNQFVNSIVWRDNTINWAPVWCDISSRIIVGTYIAVPAAALTITRRLYTIWHFRTTTFRQEKAIDLAVCAGLPLSVMVLYLFVQGNRFKIFEQIGCFPASYNTTLTYVIIWIWPPLLGTFSMVYGSLAMVALLRRRRRWNQIFKSSSGLSLDHYFRLITFAGMDAMLAIPIGILIICINVTQHERLPWIGVANAHWDFTRVEQYPAVVWRLNKWSIVLFNLDRWFIISCAVVSFAFFGLAEECRTKYSNAYWDIMRRFRNAPKPKALTFANLSSFRGTHLPMSSQGGLKVLGSTDTEVKKRDSSISSFGDPSASRTDNTTLDEPSVGKSPAEADIMALPPLYDEIDLPDLQDLNSVPTTAEILPPGLPRPARCASLDNKV